MTSTTDSVGCALSGTNAPQAGVTALGNGLYAVFYVPVVSGSLTLLVTIGSTAILTQSGTFSVTVAVGAPDAAKSGALCCPWPCRRASERLCALPAGRRSRTWRMRLRACRAR